MGLGIQIGVRHRVGGEVGVCLHHALQVDDVGHRGLVLTLGVVQVDNAAHRGILAGHNALGSGVVFRGDGDAALPGDQMGIAVGKGPGHVIAGSGQGPVLNISNGRNTGFTQDVGLCHAAVEGTDDNVLVADHAAAGDACLSALAFIRIVADARLGDALVELEQVQILAGLTVGVGIGGGYRFHRQGFGLEVHILQPGFHLIAGKGIAFHLLKGNSRHLIGHHGPGPGFRQGPGKHPDLGSLHAVLAAALDIGQVHALGSGFGFAACCADQRNTCAAGGVTCRGDGAAESPAAGGGIVHQGFYRHVAGGEISSGFDAGLLVQIQVGQHVRHCNFCQTQVQSGANTLGVGITLAQNLNVHIPGDLHLAGGCQGGSAGKLGAFFVHGGFRQVHRPAHQVYIHALAGGGGFGFGDGRVVRADVQAVCPDVPAAGIDVGFKRGLGRCHAHQYAETHQADAGIAARIVGLGNGAAQCFHLDGSRGIQGRIYRLCQHPGVYLGDGGVGINGEAGDTEAAVLAGLTAAGDDGAGGHVGHAFIKPGRYGDVVSCHRCAIQAGFLTAQQSGFHIVHCQVAHFEAGLRGVETGFRLCRTRQVNGQVSIRRTWVILTWVRLHFPIAGNSGSGGDFRVGQCDVCPRIDHSGGKSGGRLCAHGLGPGSVGVTDSDGTAFDLFAGSSLHVCAEAAACMGVDLGQEQGDQAQLAALDHIAPGMGIAHCIQSNGAGDVQVRIGQERLVGAAEPGQGNIGGGVDGGNGDTISPAVASAQHGQGAFKGIRTVKVAVAVQSGGNGQGCPPDRDVLHTGPLGHSHIGGDDIGRKGDSRYFHIEYLVFLQFIKPVTQALVIQQRGTRLGLRSGRTVSSDVHAAPGTENSAAVGITQDAGGGIGQVPGNGHVHLRPHEFNVHAAHRRSNDGLGIADVSVGDGDIVGGDVLFHAADAALGLNIGIKGALGVGISCVQSHGDQTES